MTVIDSLVVLLGLDAEDLNRKSPAAVKKLNDLEKQGDKTEKQTAKIGKTSKETSRNIEGLSRVVTTFLAAIGGTIAIKAFIQDFIDTNAQLDRLSKNLNLNVAEISAWSNASERLGGSAQGLQGTLDMLSKSQTQLMLTGESSLIPYMSALGMSLADTAGKARPVTDILLELSDRFSRMDRTTANNMGRMMGIDQGTMNLLLQGRKELELQISRQKEHNAVTKAQAEAAARLQTRLVDLKQGFAALGRQLLMDALPGLEKLLTIFENIGSWIEGHKEFVADFLKVLAVGLAGVAIAAAPISLTVVAVLALAAGIALLWEDYQVWKKGGDSLIDWGKWKPGLDAATEALRTLRDLLESIFGDKSALKRYQDNFTAGIDALVPDWMKKLLNKGHENDPNWIGIPGKTGRAAGAPTAPASGGDARALAQKVSDSTGIPADLIFAQWQHETANFTNRGSRELNNYAGINVPGGKGQDYRKFDSPDDFATYYAKLLRNDYPDALKATNADRFAAALKNGKLGAYYSAPEDQYAAGMNRFLSQDHSGYAKAMLGIPGASAAAAQAPTGSGTASGGDKSVQTSIGEVNIQTNATDAQGMARGAKHSLEWLFSSQANWGLN